MGFMGETIGDSLPVLVKAPIDTADMVVPMQAEVVTYFSSAGAGNLMNSIAMMACKPIVQAKFCPT
jgi:hypothetical protein